MATPQELVVTVKLEAESIDEAIEKLQALRKEVPKDVGPVVVTDPEEGKLYNPLTHVPRFRKSVFVIHNQRTKEGYMVEEGEWVTVHDYLYSSERNISPPAQWCKISKYLRAQNNNIYA